MRARRTFTLDAETLALLKRVGNYSDYANKLFLQHARQWTEGLAVLRERGWRSEEILAACDALGGYSLSISSAGAKFVSDELERIEETRKEFALRQISAQRRARCFDQVRTDPVVASALVFIVREFWLENEDCRHAIRSEPRRD
jgi:uncharacterized protein CbrC (UPF0167 family)